MPTESFSYTGSEQTYDVPSGVSEVTVRCWGAGGGSGHNYNASDEPGGTGGYAESKVSVSGGETLYVYVGGQGGNGGNGSVGSGGWNGGAPGGDGPYDGAHGGGGGGASDVRQNGNSTSDRVIVAGGGGGGGAAFDSDNVLPGGDGGGSDGANGSHDSDGFADGEKGYGGSQSPFLFHI